MPTSATTKTTRKKVLRLPVPAPAESPLKNTNLKLSAGTQAALARLKGKGYSKTFAIETGVFMLENSLRERGAML